MAANSVDPHQPVGLCKSEFTQFANCSRPE